MDFCPFELIEKTIYKVYFVLELFQAGSDVIDVKCFVLSETRSKPGS